MIAFWLTLCSAFGSSVSTANTKCSASEIKSIWAISLSCRGWSSPCYATSSGGYSSRSGAKTFDSIDSAQRFIRQLSKSIQRMNPQVTQLASEQHTPCTEDE
ncbi:hypothetical protein KCM76_20260 [Zooshikella marina]|uniref:hypothetical protein n=1 Tax=Zooshikella ganghwensis TaxID=202772 RepID=UPI001BAF9F73|nr:hypothetical protein [Zooshikella ganghwensis]MBU2708337.1 hypothetical protein [Zooshikella ganghwensis]